MTKIETKITAALKPINVERRARVVSVRLSSEDYKRATLAAQYSHQTLTEWIRTMVNTSTQP